VKAFVIVKTKIYPLSATDTLRMTEVLTRRSAGFFGTDEPNSVPADPASPRARSILSIYCASGWCFLSNRAAVGYAVSPVRFSRTGTQADPGSGRAPCGLAEAQEDHSRPCPSEAAVADCRAVPPGAAVLAGPWREHPELRHCKRFPFVLISVSRPAPANQIWILIGRGD